MSYMEVMAEIQRRLSLAIDIASGTENYDDTLDPAIMARYLRECEVVKFWTEVKRLVEKAGE